MPYVTIRKKDDDQWVTRPVKEFFDRHSKWYCYFVEVYEWRYNETAVLFKDSEGNELVVSKDYAREHFHKPDLVE